MAKTPSKPVEHGRIYTLPGRLAAALSAWLALDDGEAEVFRKVVADPDDKRATLEARYGEGVPVYD